MPKDRRRNDTKERTKEQKRSREDDAGGSSSRKRAKESKRQRSSPPEQPRSVSKADEQRRRGRGTHKDKQLKDESRSSPSRRGKPHILDRVNVRSTSDTRKADVAKVEAKAGHQARSRASGKASGSAKLIETEEDFWKRTDSQKPILDRITFSSGVKPPKKASQELMSRSPSPVAALPMPLAPKVLLPPTVVPATKAKPADRHSKHHGSPTDGQPPKQTTADRSHAERSAQRHERRRSRSRERSRDRSRERSRDKGGDAGSKQSRHHRRRQHSSDAEPASGKHATAVEVPSTPAGRTGREALGENRVMQPPRERDRDRYKRSRKEHDDRERHRGARHRDSRDTEEREEVPVSQHRAASQKESHKESNKESRHKERRQKGSRKRDKRDERDRERDREREDWEAEGQEAEDWGREVRGSKREEEWEERSGRLERQNKYDERGKDRSRRDRHGHDNRRDGGRSRKPEQGRSGRRAGSASVRSISSTSSSERGDMVEVNRTARSDRAPEGGAGAASDDIAAGAAVAEAAPGTRRRADEVVRGQSARQGQASGEGAAPPEALPDPPRAKASPRPQRHDRHTSDTATVRDSSERGVGAFDGRGDAAAAPRERTAAYIPAAPAAAADRAKRQGSQGRTHEARAPAARQDHGAGFDGHFRPAPPSVVGGIRGTSGPGAGWPPPRRPSPLASERPLPPPPPVSLPGPPRPSPEEPLGHFMPRQQHSGNDAAPSGARHAAMKKGEVRDGMLGDLMGDGAAPERRDVPMAWGVDSGAGVAFAHAEDRGPVGGKGWRPLLDEGLGGGAHGWGGGAGASEVADGYLVGGAAAPEAEEVVCTPLQLPGYSVGSSVGLRSQMAVWKQTAKATLRSAQMHGGAVAEVFARLDSFLGSGCVESVQGGERLRHVTAVHRHCGGAGGAGWLPVHQGRRRADAEAEWDEEQWRLEVRQSSDAVFACSEALKREREAEWCAMGSDGAFVHGLKGAAVVFAGGSAEPGHG